MSGMQHETLALVADGPVLYFGAFPPGTLTGPSTRRRALWPPSTSDDPGIVMPAGLPF